MDFVQGFHLGRPKRLSAPTAFEQQRAAHTLAGFELDASPKAADWIGIGE